MKAAVDIVSVLLIVVFAIGLFATVYAYGLPLIQKRQDASLADTVDSLFNPDNVNSLATKIIDTANNGGQETFSVQVPGF